MGERIRQIMATVFNTTIENIDCQSTYESIESWDSVKHINLIMALEEEYNMEFDEEEIMEMLSYESILKILNFKNS